MISRLTHKRSRKAGLPPGTLIHIGERKTEKVAITMLDYNERGFRERRLEKIEECFPFPDAETVTWLDINGVHEREVLEQVGRSLAIHPLVLEDIMNTGQRPKLEDLGDYLFLVLKMVRLAEGTREIELEQVSLLVGRNYLVSFQEKEGDLFEAVRERIRAGKGKIRGEGSDYLAYSLLDAIVDHYFLLFERLGEQLEGVEARVLMNPVPETSLLIHALKRDLIFLRRSIWPLREVVSRLERGEHDLIRPSTRIFLRDVYDHVIHSLDTMETYRDMLSGMLDVYLSSASNRLNEVMKVLTVIATIFIPLTFITGVYGMNFAHMPELAWSWAYPHAFWLVILVLAGFMIFMFRRRKWL